MTTAAGWDPFVERQPGDTPAISRPLQVYQTIPMSDDRSTLASSTWCRPRGPPRPSSRRRKARRPVRRRWPGPSSTENMREIPGHIPITEIQLEDEPQVRAIVDMDLRMMVMQRMDGQLVNGPRRCQQTWWTPSLRGYRHGAAVGRTHVNKPVPFEWAATSSVRNDQIDDAKKAKTKLILTGRVMPNRYYFHHEIWDEISLVRDHGGRVLPRLTGDGVPGDAVGSPGDPDRPSLLGDRGQHRRRNVGRQPLHADLVPARVALRNRFELGRFHRSASSPSAPRSGAASRCAAPRLSCCSICRPPEP